MTSIQSAILVVSGLFTLVQGGAAALLVWVFRRVISGELVARSVLDDVRKDRDERVADAQETSQLWQAAHIKSEETRSVLTAQVNQLLETGRISEALLRALKAYATDKEPQT